MIDPYAALGVSPSATQAEIAHAYRRQLRNYHPDLRSGERDSGADQRLRHIIAAYQLLRDAQRRRAYDRAAVRHRKNNPPTRITVTRKHPADVGAPLWAGPVRWHR
ncbi:J domain-containing protein [Mycobacterium shinjukuense]|uniref:Uncharacterized protein n=1 Tax=Mycobacterium shinjukuense TaxID=398694 RepID=A0A7I7MSH0_9MYCO|nr:J domain-containing protein [Mycobacterium shinjukuense]MCV6985382.1 J domain-containing protein [Mycobacterium shinjukuense]ORB66466.1 hypothetical protein BST45_13940 [Mycobacterium shinjukuense]BBX74523.1 hypothetical protein MSHI_24290 [Mycobacterium shinjukuense]